MSLGVRPRRLSDPPLAHSRPINPRYDRLDADEKREAVSKGYLPTRKQYPPGGIDLARTEWRLLLLIVLLAAGVRLFRISQPNSVV